MQKLLRSNTKPERVRLLLNNPRICEAGINTTNPNSLKDVKEKLDAVELRSQSETITDITMIAH